MELIKNTTNYNIIGARFYFLALSTILLLGSLYLWFATGDAKFGVDFRGGSEFIVQFHKSQDIGELREALAKGGFPEALVQSFQEFPNRFSIRVGSSEGGKAASTAMKGVFGALQNDNYELLKEDFVGPVIGEQIRRDAIIAFFISIVGILIYVTVQFDFSFGVGALISLLHDGIIAVGATILANKQLGAHTLAAVLTIVGYSVNDTIVIYDRIRENLTNAAKSGSAGKKGTAEKLHGMSLAQIMNRSINETFSRTLLTSLTVVFVCLTLWLMGGGTVSDLAFTLLIGVIVGTYSSIFIACPYVLAVRKDREKK